jgi:hypothetical protein
MKSRNLILFLLGIFLVLFGLQTLFALGITPARTSIDFQAGLHKEVNFSVLNTENKDMSVTFSVKGNLAQYITFEEEFADFSSSESSKSFTYTVDLPEGFDVPGRYEGEIVALEVSKDVKEEGTFIGAAVAVVTQIHVYVPYPEEYIEAELKVVSSEQGSNTLFLIPIVNRGKKDVSEIGAVIDIYAPSGEKIATINSKKESLKKLERKELSASWVANVSAGVYLANATISYNSKELVLSKEFNVGEILLEIKEVSVKDFELGQIAKFELLIQNKWSHQVNNTYVNILIYDSQGRTLADFKTPNQDFQPLQEIRLPAYWDTAGVSEGLYEGKLVLHYGETKKSERNVQFRITNYEIEVIGLTGKVIVKNKGALNVTNVLIAIVVLLVLSNVIWFLRAKHIKKK